jgi:hypothetical protein
MAARRGTREEGRLVLITAPVATGRPGVLRWCGKAVALCGNKWRWRDMDGAAARTAGGGVDCNCSATPARTVEAQVRAGTQCSVPR